MITIRPIQPEEIPAARRMIITVAYGIFGWKGTLEESIRYFEASGKLADMDDIQSHYFQNGGLFLAVVEGNRIIGTGALRRLDLVTAELKRMWLLPDFHGQGIGYMLFSQLRNFAHGHNYQRIWLQTSPEQTRALAFYRRLGFHEIPCYNDDLGEISMELNIQGT
ncbi:MAG: GNAT family N-acetyltransferase [Chloroflexota bacterium]